MMQPERRRVLAALAGITTLGGCSTSSESNPTSPKPNSTEIETTTQTRHQTKTDTPTPEEKKKHLSDSDLEFLVTVVRQPSENSPGRIRAALTNHMNVSLEVTGGDPLPVGKNILDADRIDASSPLMLFPQQSDTKNEYMSADSGDPLSIEDAIYGDCWAMPDNILQTAAGMGLILSPNASVVADYFPLAHPGADCPKGTYRVYGEIAIESENRSQEIVETEMEVAVGKEDLLSVDGTLSLPES
ncbi:hypothetical protein [Haloparvum sp. PAK95]|uniref:hypothetical protein n=1 Tax=Haloparvum sp. PAK95 TaxID=3418962 RepID=UPI003D2EDC3A